MSFLNDYREFCAGSEAHPSYHIFSGLVALSSTISRRIWVEQGYFKVYPNLYVVLVGPPGNRKTSAMSIAKGFIREMGNIPFSAEAVTKEKLVLDTAAQTQTLEDMPESFGTTQRIHSPMTVMVTELSEFLGLNSVGMISFLTTVYDQDIYESRTKNKGDVILTGPFINLLACTTPDWITNYLRSDVISGGFSRRAIFVLETGKSGRIAFPEVTDAAKQAWSRALDRAKKIQKLCGPLVWETKAKAFYEHWYRTLEMPVEETISGYYETKHMQLLKIAMLLSISENSDLVLRVNHLEGGLALLKLAEDNLSRVFAGIGRNQLNSAASKVEELLMRHPMRRVRFGEQEKSVHIISEKVLRASLFSHVNEVELLQVLEHLRQVEKIGIQIIEENGLKRKYIYLIQ